jgi:hypothetical protein
MAYDEADVASADEAPPAERKHSDEDLHKLFSQWDRDVMDAQSHWAVEARLCYDMVSGEQWEETAKKQLKDECVAAITWNRIQPLVDAVSGAQIQNRHETKYYPREIGDVGVNETLTAAAEWVGDEGDFEDEETDAFYDALVCGLGWTELRIDYEEEPDGQILKDRVDALEMRWDPSSRKRNLADARYYRRKRPFSKDQFKDRFPEWAGKIDTGTDSDQPATSTDNPGDDYNDDTVPDERKSKNEIFVKEYQWFEIETFFTVYDSRTGEKTEFEEEAFENLIAELKARNMLGRMDWTKQKRRCYYRAFCADDEILDYEEMPKRRDGSPVGFTYHAITGKRDRNKGTWYGLVRSMVDPQRWANKWLTQILVIINKNAKGGAFVEIGALAEPNKAIEDWSQPNPLIFVNSGALAGGAIRERTAPPYPQGLDRLIQMAIASIRDVTGINQELLGMVDRDQPGILEQQRKEAGYAMLSMYFDALRRYRKMSGRTLLDFIQLFLSPETKIRIVGQEGGVKYVALGDQRETARFDVIVDEAPSGPNQKDKVWAMIVQMLPLLTRQPLPPEVWAEALRYSPIPSALAEKFGAALVKPPDPQQQQAMAEQQIMQKAMAQAQLRKLNAEAAGKEADAQATMGELPLRQMELQIDAQKLQVDAQKTQADFITSQANAQSAMMDAGQRRADAELTAAKTELTKAQTAHQVIESAISKLFALRDTLVAAETEVRITT